MLDIAWPELIVIGAVALVAVGPKDLPKVMHTLGRLAGKARNVMHDMRVTIEQVGYEPRWRTRRPKKRKCRRKHLLAKKS